MLESSPIVAFAAATDLHRARGTAPAGDKVAWFTDPDGNVLSLTQFL